MALNASKSNNLKQLALKGLRRGWKTPRERSTSGPGLEHDDGEELGDDEGLN